MHVALWRRLGRFDGRCSLKTWTYRVAHNTAASHVDRERRTHRDTIAIDGAGDLADTYSLARTIEETDAALALEARLRTFLLGVGLMSTVFATIGWLNARGVKALHAEIAEIDRARTADDPG